LQATLTAWRWGGISCSFRRQLKPIKDKRFNGFYYSLIYNVKPELKMNSERLLMVTTSRRPNAKPRVEPTPTVKAPTFQLKLRTSIFIKKIYYEKKMSTVK